MPGAWLLKTEPSTYSWGDLVRDGKTVWDGVSNAAALINLRAMRTGDEALIYHSGDGKAIVGIARITRGAYADPKLKDPKRVVIEVQPVRALKTPVTLAAVKAEPALAQLGLVRMSRLSCMPVSAEQRAVLRKLGVR
jgi:predicted RNA-binding protein with PUA-like domain